MMMLRHPWIFARRVIIIYLMTTNNNKVAAVQLLEADEPALLLESVSRSINNNMVFVLYVAKLC